MRRRLWLIGTGLLLFGLAFGIACGGDDDDDNGTTQGAESQLCGDLAQLNTALNQMRSLTSSSTVNEAKSAEQNVENAFADVKDSAKDVKAAKLNQVDDAHESLQKSMNNLSGSQTLGSAATTLQSDASAIVQAETALRTSLKCP